MISILCLGGTHFSIKLLPGGHGLQSLANIRNQVRNIFNADRKTNKPQSDSGDLGGIAQVVFAEIQVCRNLDHRLDSAQAGRRRDEFESIYELLGCRQATLKFKREYPATSLHLPARDFVGLPTFQEWIDHPFYRIVVSKIFCDGQR